MCVCALTKTSSSANYQSLEALLIIPNKSYLSVLDPGVSCFVFVADPQECTSWVDMPRRGSVSSRRRRRPSTSPRPDGSSTSRATRGPATWRVNTCLLWTLLMTVADELHSWHVCVCVCIVVLSMLPPLKEAIVNQLNSESLTALLKTKWVEWRLCCFLRGRGRFWGTESNSYDVLNPPQIKWPGAFWLQLVQRRKCFNIALGRGEKVCLCLMTLKVKADKARAILWMRETNICSLLHFHPCEQQMSSDLTNKHAEWNHSSCWSSIAMETETTGRTCANITRIKLCVCIYVNAPVCRHVFCCCSKRVALPRVFRDAASSSSSSLTSCLTDQPTSWKSGKI